MKNVALLLTCVAVLGLVTGMMFAGEGEGGAKPKPAKPAALKGKVVKVEGLNVVLSVKAKGEKEAKEVTVVTDDKTEVVIDDKAAKLDDLKADMLASVTPAEGVAQKIVVAPAKKKEGGEKKEGGAAE